MNNISIDPLRVIKRNLEFKGILSGRNVDILGNGPSLRSFKESVPSNFLISCNEFHKTHLYGRVNPDLHLLVDPVYYLEPEKFLVPVLNSLINISDCPVILANIRVLQFVVSSVQYQGAFRWLFIDFTEEGEFGYDLSRPIKRIGQNVINLGIIFALFGSANYIRLFGVDMDILDMTEEMYFSDWNWNHSWQKSEADEGLKTGFEGMGLGWGDLKKAILRMNFEFNLLKVMVDKAGCQVVNMNQYSKLNVFKKISA